MKAVVGWEGNLNNFFLKSLDLWKRPRPKTTGREPDMADQLCLSALDKAKADVRTALCDSVNTSTAMRVLSDPVSESNSAEARGMAGDAAGSIEKGRRETKEGRVYALCCAVTYNSKQLISNVCMENPTFYSVFT